MHKKNKTSFHLYELFYLISYVKYYALIMQKQIIEARNVIKFKKRDFEAEITEKLGRTMGRKSNRRLQ